MSTKFKVIAGFLLVIVALGVLAFMGVSATRNTIKTFNEYKRVATLNVNVSDLEAAMNKAAYKTLLYAWFFDEAEGKAALESLNNAQESLDHALEFVKLPERKALLESWKKDIVIYKQGVGVYIEQEAAMGDLLTGSLTEQPKTIKADIDAAENQARAVGNSYLSEQFSTLQNNFSDFDKNLVRYVERQAPDFKKPVDDALVKLNNSLAALAGYSGVDQAQFKKIETGIKAYIKSYDTAQGHMERIFDSDKVRGDIEKAMFGKMKSMNVEILAQQTKLGETIEGDNATALRMILIVSGVGILISLITMIVIITSLVRTLKAVAIYADEITNGNFDAKLTAHEPGELGLVINSMRNIPVVLGRMVQEYKALGDKAVHGHLRDRADIRDFKGEYAGLVKETNSLLDNFAAVLDLIPAMVIAYDLDYKVTYMNKSALNFLGDFAGKACPENFRTPLGRPTDPVNQPEATFTDIKGRNMHVSISATPNIDTKNAVIGAITVLNDITAINEAYSVMTQVAKEADVFSERVVTAAEELSAQVEQITDGTELQRDQVASTATAMEEMNATVLDVARNAGAASKQSDDTRNKAQEGAELVSTLVRNINRVNTIANTLHTDMQSLGSQAEAIGGVMDVISNIADQTNLLALNAAIEAARAGDAGRGFAVVADEVRKLAENTMSATSEVGSSIKAIQEATIQNIKNVTEAVESVHEATQMANTSGESLKDIVTLANDNSMLISGIATAAEEQSATSEEINRSVDQISQIAGETANGMAESSAAVRELSSVAQELKTLLEKLNSVASRKK